jgi:hypothetical protein
MVKHIVIWKLKDIAGGGYKIANAQLIKDKLEALNGKIPGVRKVEVGIDFLQTETSGDIVLYSEMETVEALVAYQAHPQHLEAGAFIGEVVSEKIVVDYVC